MTTITWERKSLFSNTFLIKKGKHEIGRLTDETFSREATGIINSKKYIFKKKKLWDSGFIITTGDNRPVGKIRYTAWKSDVRITLHQKKSYLFHDQSVWKDPKLITGMKDRKDLFRFSSKSFSKKNLIDLMDVTSLDTDNKDLLILLGVYLKNQDDITFYIILIIILVVIVIS